MKRNMRKTFQKVLQQKMTTREAQRQRDARKRTMKKSIILQRRKLQGAWLFQRNLLQHRGKSIVELICRTGYGAISVSELVVKQVHTNHSQMVPENIDCHSWYSTTGSLEAKVI